MHHRILAVAAIFLISVVLAIGAAGVSSAAGKPETAPTPSAPSQEPKQVFDACFPILVHARSWSQVTVRVMASGTWRPCYGHGLSGPRAGRAATSATVALRGRPMGLPLRWKLVDLGHISYPMRNPWGMCQLLC